VNIDLFLTLDCPNFSAKRLSERFLSFNSLIGWKGPLKEWNQNEGDDEIPSKALKEECIIDSTEHAQKCRSTAYLCQIEMD
jgi:hypothetical protein